MSVLSTTTTLLPLTGNSRKPVQFSRLHSRTTLFALCTLCALAVFIIFRPSIAQPPTIAVLSRPKAAFVVSPDAAVPDGGAAQAQVVPEAAADEAAAPRSRIMGRPHRAPAQPPKTAPPALVLTPEEELAAVSAFLAALPSNTIPRSVDPSKPIDPQLVLDFNVRGPSARKELDQTVKETWARYPVMAFAKKHSAVSREVIRMLDSMQLNPAPKVFEVDLRSDKAVLLPLIERVTGASEFPVVVIGGTPRSGIDALRAMHESGELKELVQAAGAQVDGAHRKKGRR